MRSVDTVFLGITAILTALGFFIFISASMGLLAREGAEFSRVVINQVFFGLVLGCLALFAFSKFHYRVWRKYAFYVLIGALILTALVFVPGLGMTHGGATRWISLGFLSFQPAEVLKVGFVIYFATWLSGMKGKKVETWRYGAIPLCALLAVISALLLMQPDTGTLVIIVLTGFGMYWVAGGKWSHLAVLGGIGASALTVLMFVRPYLRSRVMTFIDPSQDPLGSGYQIKQSLIAIGSGRVNGRGLGQSVQKFDYLPEPIGDSIFAVFAEEWGLVGALLLIALFLAFALRGFKIASQSRDKFGELLVIGLVLLIVIQSFMNIAAMLAILPLSGMPLIFVSHGGTALMVALATVGIILNVSRYNRS